MSGVRQTLLAQLARFDDEAFVALANRGLLRRAQKDLDRVAANIVEETPNYLVVRFAEQSVRFDGRGPTHAQCSCPASGICQHILAAAMALQRLAQSDEPAAVLAGNAHAPSASAGPTGDSTGGVEPSEHTAMVDKATAGGGEAGRAADAEAPAGSELASLHDALLAIPHAELVKHAGKPGYRWAWQFVQDLDPEHGAHIGGDRHIVIALQRPRVTMRFMGGGVGSLVADSQSEHLAKYQVAAVLAYRRAHGVQDAPPEVPSRAKMAVLDLGKDHALPDNAADARQDSRQRLRSSLVLLLEDCVGLGLSHLSRGIQERYATLAVWAQGAEYYRVALLLRRIADHVELLIERAGGADEHRLFDEMTIAYGLVKALGSAAKKGAEPRHLVGRARSRYEEAGNLELLGLGAVPWRSASGYLGLTMLFWSPAEQAFRTCTDARPELQRRFNPRQRYFAPGPWSGLASPQQATGRCVRLVNALVNDQGRLSAAEATSATVSSPGDFVARLKPYGSWGEISQQRAAFRSSLLGEAGAWRDWIVLAPASWGEPRFDANRQMLTWPLLDATGRRVDAELPYSEHNEHAVQRIEQLADAGVPNGALLVARLRGSATNFVAEPLSLIRPVPPGGDNPVDALHFDAAPRQRLASRWLDKLLRRDGAVGADVPLAAIDRHAPLRTFRQWLQRQAERGFAAERVAALRHELALEVGRLAALGYTAFAPADDAGALSAALLVAHYTCLQYERLIGDGDGLFASDEEG